MRKNAYNISATQVAYAYEVADDLKTFAELVLASKKPADEFDEYLYAWFFALSSLTREVLFSTIVLLEKDQLRGAFILSRSLIDYHLRLRYYYHQAMPVMKTWRGNRVPKHLKNALRKIDAYQDWQNAMPKLLAPLKVRPLHLDDLSEKDRAKFEKRIYRDEKLHSRRIEHMARTIYVEDSKQFGFVYSTYQYRSVYAHGDQAILPEVIGSAEDTLKIEWKTLKMSAYHILAESLFFTLNLAESGLLITGFSYAFHRNKRLFHELFKEPAYHPL